MLNRISLLKFLIKWWLLVRLIYNILLTFFLPRELILKILYKIYTCTLVIRFTCFTVALDNDMLFNVFECRLSTTLGQCCFVSRDVSFHVSRSRKVRTSYESCHQQLVLWIFYYLEIFFIVSNPIYFSITVSNLFLIDFPILLLSLTVTNLFTCNIVS